MLPDYLPKNYLPLNPYVGVGIWGTNQTKPGLKEYGSHGQPRLTDYDSQKRQHVAVPEPMLKGGKFKKLKESSRILAGAENVKCKL